MTSLRLWLIGWLSVGLVTLALPQLRLLWEVPNCTQEQDEGTLAIQQLKIADPAGSLYIWGNWFEVWHDTWEGDTDLDALFFKYAPDGRLLWEWRYDGDDNPNDTSTSGDYAGDFALDSQGNILLTTTSILRGYDSSVLRIRI